VLSVTSELPWCTIRSSTLHLNANRPGTSKSVNIKELGSTVVAVHALKAYRWSRSLVPSIGDPIIFLGSGGEGLILRPELFGGG
jgi:hypothetical protein